VKRNKVIAGPVIYYLNKPDTIWCAGFKINKLFVIPKCIGRGKKGIVYSNYIVCDALPSPFIVSRECALRIRFDDTFKFCNEDVDFCLRASKLGYKIIVVPEAKVWHDRRTYNSIYELFYIKKPEIGYFLFRNVFILCKKLNKRIHMFVVSLALTLILNLINILIVITLTHNKIVGRNIVRGLIDGFRLAVTTPMESY
jgi:GT2 family glycosyltransferase